VSAEFEQGGSLPILFEALDRSGNATQKFDALEQVLNACKSITSTNDGTTNTLSVGAMSFPAQANQSVAYDVSGTISGVTVNIGFVLMRKSDYLILVGLGEIGSLDSGSLQTFITTALNKLPETS
jgi:hypothetical protein